MTASLFPDNQAGLFTNQGQGGGGPYVVSINGRSGIVTLTHLDISDWTAATKNFLTANQPITVSGDVTGGPASTALTLSLGTQALTPGTYAGLTVNSKGIVTGARDVQLGDITQSGAAEGNVPLWNGTAWVPANAGAIAGGVTEITAGQGLSGGAITATGTIALGPISAGSLLANTGTATAIPSATTPSAMLDAALGSSVGSVAIRGPSGWTSLPAGADGYVLTSSGTLASPAWEPTASAVSAGTDINVTSGTVSVQGPTNAPLLATNGSGGLASVTVGTGLSLSSGVLSASGGSGASLPLLPGFGQFLSSGGVWQRPALSSFTPYNAATTGFPTATDIANGPIQVIGGNEDGVALWGVPITPNTPFTLRGLLSTTFQFGIGNNWGFWVGDTVSGNVIWAWLEANGNPNLQVWEATGLSATSGANAAEGTKLADVGVYACAMPLAFKFSLSSTNTLSIMYSFDPVNDNSYFGLPATTVGSSSFLPQVNAGGFVVFDASNRGSDVMSIWGQVLSYP